MDAKDNDTELDDATATSAETERKDSEVEAEKESSENSVSSDSGGDTTEDNDGDEDKAAMEEQLSSQGDDPEPIETNSQELDHKTDEPKSDAEEPKRTALKPFKQILREFIRKPWGKAIVAIVAILVVAGAAYGIWHTVLENTTVETAADDQLCEGHRGAITFAVPNTWCEESYTYGSYDDQVSYDPKSALSKMHFTAIGKSADSKLRNDELESACESFFSELKNACGITTSSKTNQRLNKGDGWTQYEETVTDGAKSCRIVVVTTPKHHSALIFQGSAKDIERHEAVIDQIIDSIEMNPTEVASVFEYNLGEVDFKADSSWSEESTSSTMIEFKDSKGYVYICQSKYNDGKSDKYQAKYYLESFFKNVGTTSLEADTTTTVSNNEVYEASWTIKPKSTQNATEYVRSVHFSTGSHFYSIIFQRLSSISHSDIESFLTSVKINSTLKGNVSTFFETDQGKEIYSLFRSYDFTGASNKLDEYLATEKGGGDSTAKSFRTHLDNVLSYSDQVDISTDEVTGTKKVYYKGLTEVSSSDHIIPYIENHNLHCTFGFVKSDWVFFTKVRINFENTSDYFYASYKSYKMTRDVLGGSTIKECNDDQISTDKNVQLFRGGNATLIRFEGNDKNVDYDVSSTENEAMAMLGNMYSELKAIADLYTSQWK